MVIDSPLLFALTGLGLVVLSSHAFFTQAHLLRKILALNVMGSGVFLVLIAFAARDSLLKPDPVPHALVLTGIVIAISATALALHLARRVYHDRALYLANQGHRDSGGAAGVLPEEDKNADD